MANASERTMLLLRNLMIASVLIETIAAFIVTYLLEIGPTADTQMAFLTVASLAFIALSATAIVRFVLLPSIAKQDTEGRWTAHVLACSFSQAPATYGLVAAIISGHGLIALPFAAISLLSFFVLLSYVDELYPAAQEP
ncbi:MAG: hypothetical protein WEB04_09525 [Dehalococcoidia bacterium]